VGATFLSRPVEGDILTIWEYGDRYCHIKTTIDIPDALMIRAKKKAAELRRPVRELVIEGLQARLDEKPSQQAVKQPVTIRWVTHPGGPPPDVDLSDRTSMQKLFER